MKVFGFSCESFWTSGWDFFIFAIKVFWFLSWHFLDSPMNCFWLSMWFSGDFLVKFVWFLTTCALHCCVGHTAWVPEGREEPPTRSRDPAGPYTSSTSYDSDIQCSIVQGICNAVSYIRSLVQFSILQCTAVQCILVQHRTLPLHYKTLNAAMWVAQDCCFAPQYHCTFAMHYSATDTLHYS